MYLDAVFHPRLSQQTFFQEGWHYEVNDKGDMMYKGVVFNEMKGSYSNPDSILGDHITQGLYPDNEYRFDQGGEPLHIPDLSYRDFVSFHRQHYHPSNARIFFYGDGDRHQHLQAVQDYLKEFEVGEQTMIPELQTEFSSARTVQASYPTSVGSVAKAYTTINWLLHNLTESVDRLGFEILNYLLLESDAAPLKNALLESGLGEDIAGIGYETDLRQPVFSAGLKGVDEIDIEKVEKLILDKLYELARDGISADVVKGAVNRVEFEYRESTAGSYPRGLVFFLKSMQTWLYGGDPLDGLFFATRFAELRKRIDGGEKYFENLIKSQLLNNKHRLIVRLLPDTEHITRLEAQEQQQLQKFAAQMSETDKQQIMTLAKELEQWQQSPDKPEDLATLPALHLADIDKHVRQIPQEMEHVGAADIFRHDLHTNGIVYLAAGFDVTYLPQELLAYLSVFTEAIFRLGTEKYDYEELATLIDLDTGGIDTNLHISPVIEGDIGKLVLFLSGKSTEDKVARLLELMRELIVNVKLDQQDKFKQVILEEKAKLESALTRSGHALVFNRAAAHYRQACLVTEEVSGINYLFSLRRMLDQVEHDWQSALAEFKKLHELILNQGKLMINFTADPHTWDMVKSDVQKFAQEFPDNRNHGLPEIKYELLKQNEGFIIPASVNFVGQSFDMAATGYELQGAVYLVQNLLNRDYIWNRVRVQGGAYGGFADYQVRIGVLLLASYRDPNVTQTLQAYQGTPDYLLKVALDDSELEKNVIGAIGRLDKYLEPESKGWVAFDWYLSGTTPELRQKLRDQLLSVSIADIRKFGEKLLQAMQTDGRTAILGEREKILQADESLQLGLKIEPIL